MTIGHLGSLFLLALGSGAVVWLPLVKPADIRSGFFAFMLGGAALLMLGGLALHPAWTGSVGFLGGVAVHPAVAFLGGPVLWALAAVLAPAAFQSLPVTRPCLVLVALVSLGGAFYIPELKTVGERLGFTASALVLGSVLAAMILGHWYLMVDGLDIAHLRRMNHALGASLLFRTAVTGWAVWQIHGLAHVPPEPTVQAGSFMPAHRIWEQVVTDPVQGLALFFWMRVGIGLAGVGALVFMIRHTIGLKATQPSTGLLYVALCLVLLGEMTGFYLWGRTGWSL